MAGRHRWKDRMKNGFGKFKVSQKRLYEEIKAELPEKRFLLSLGERVEL